MSTNTEYPSMNVGSVSINTFNNGLTIMDRNTFPVSVFLKTDVAINRMILNGNNIINGSLSINKFLVKEQQYAAPNTGDTLSIDPLKTIVIINPAGPIAVLNLQMPTDPADGAIVKITITQDIAAINHTAPDGASIDFPLVSAVAPATQQYYYRQEDNTWYLLVTSEGPSSVTLTCIQDQTPNPNVQLCAGTNALLGVFNNGVDKFMEIDRLNDNIIIGTDSFLNNTIGTVNIAIGRSALTNNTEGSVNVAIGDLCLNDNTTGDLNVAIGSGALSRNQTGIGNVAIGRSAITNAEGINNTAIGINSLRNMTIGTYNCAFGDNACSGLSSGSQNVAIGTNALRSPGIYDGMVAIGSEALYSNQASTNCTAVGRLSLRTNTTGSRNTAVGRRTLYFNVIGNDNVAVGNDSLEENTIDGCTAVGSSAMRLNTTGLRNTAVGYHASLNNMIGNDNVAMGSSALENNDASGNTAIGSQALESNTTGSQNVGLGQQTLNANLTGSDNTALGTQSLILATSADSNTAVGNNTLSSNLTGSGNIAMGDSAGSNILLDDNICIGNSGQAADTGIIRIGDSAAHTNTYIPTNVHIGTTGAPGVGFISMLNEYVDAGPYGDGDVVPDPTIAFGGPAISVWLITLSVASMPTGLTVTMPAPVSPGQIMRVSFIGVAGPPEVVGTGIVYTPGVDPAHTVDLSASSAGVNSFSSVWYVSPTSGLWTRI